MKMNPEEMESMSDLGIAAGRGAVGASRSSQTLLPAAGA